jgi:hypothetical protein
VDCLRLSPSQCALRGSPFPVWTKPGRNVKRLKAVSRAILEQGYNQFAHPASQKLLMDSTSPDVGLLLIPEFPPDVLSSQKRLENTAADRQCLIGDEKAGAGVIARVHIADLQALGHVNAIPDQPAQHAG